MERAVFGVFFSLTAFVTLGYGDCAPTGWFKIVTGLEAFLGVTLLALFTVAWGRKMVRSQRRVCYALLYQTSPL